MTKILAYIVMPVFFAIIGYVLLAVGLKPVWEYASAAAAVLVSEEAPSFHSSLKSMYDPDAAKNRNIPVYDQTGTVQDPVSLTPETAENGETVAPAEEKELYISIQDVDLPEAGVQYAHVSCERIGLDAPVYWDDTYEILRYGVGQYMGSYLPGFGGTVLLSGHNTTYFLPLADIQEGDIITLDTNYCTYEYEVVKTEVMQERDLGKLLDVMLSTEGENLIMYTCWPFDGYLGRKYERFTVFGSRVSGYDVKWRVE